MTQDEKREVNEKIGRALFSWTPYKGNESPMPYCADPVFVVPLAEALRARGYSVCLFAIRGQWEVTVCHEETLDRVMMDAPTAAEALAKAAAQALAEEAAQTAVL